MFAIDEEGNSRSRTYSGFEVVAREFMIMRSRVMPIL